jgi:hypothetical protein
MRTQCLTVVWSAMPQVLQLYIPSFVTCLAHILYISIYIQQYVAVCMYGPNCTQAQQNQCLGAMDGQLVYKGSGGNVLCASTTSCGLFNGTGPSSEQAWMMTGEVGGRLPAGSQRPFEQPHQAGTSESACCEHCKCEVSSCLPQRYVSYLFCSYCCQ